MKVGVMGAVGSFSEMAGEEYLAVLGIDNGTIEPLVTAENVLSSLESGLIDRGIFPIENSNGGIVLEAVYAMAKHRFAVEKMFELDVHHNLLVKPGIKAENITSITSHDQAIKQCRMYLRRRWPNAEIVAYKDTAAAAEALSQGKLSDSTAVIASKRCADIYGLEILENSIQDLRYNYTTFVVATRID